MKHAYVFAVSVALIGLARAPLPSFAAESSASRAITPLSEANARDAAGNTPLHRAALRGDAEGVEALLARGADAAATNLAGATPLHYAIESERMVAALLTHGAPLDAVSKAGITPLLGAVARSNSFAVARRLIAASASVSSRRVHPRGPKAMANVLATAIV